MIKNLAIYHPGTGTLISLSDDVQLINVDFLSEQRPAVLADLEDGVSGVPEREHGGYRLDNSNMTRLFFGE